MNYFFGRKETNGYLSLEGGIKCGDNVNVYLVA